MSTGSRIAMLDIDEAKRRAATRGIPDTMAELSVAEKDAISHRGRAAREFLAWLATR